MHGPDRDGAACRCPDHRCTWREDNACKVCGVMPDGDGDRVHGRGCRVVNAEGGGSDYVEACECKQCEATRDTAALLAPPAFVGTVGELERHLARLDYDGQEAPGKAHGESCDCDACIAAFDARCNEISGWLSGKPQPAHLVNGVQFESVPALCAAYEHALETLAALLRAYPQLRSSYATQEQQDALHDARSLLRRAGKEAP